jgi:hypothetical protein
MIEWEKRMREYLNVQSVKDQYATLYGELLTELPTNEKKSEAAGDDNVEIDGGYF